MFSSLGHIEFYFALGIALIGFVVMIVFKNQEQKVVTFLNTIFFGVAGIILLAGILTPPDLMSNVMLSLPATLGFVVVTVIKFRKQQK
jgi:hypothetical protein